MKPFSNNFLFAGLDFLLNSNGDLYFIEANSAPGLMYRYNELYGNCRPLEDLVVSIEEHLEKMDLILIYSKNFFENKPNIEFKYKKLVELTKGRCRLCLLELDELSNFSGELFDVEGKKIEKGIIFTSWLFLKKKLQRNKNFLVINPYEVSNLTVDKIKTFQVLKNGKNFFTPRTYNFSNQSQLRNIFKKFKFKDGFVIKPLDGYGGKDIYFPNSMDQALEIDFKSHHWVIQERVNIKKSKGKYWDIRTFVVNGKYCGAVKRISDNPAVNVSLGGDVTRIPPRLINILEVASEECVKKINKHLK